MILGKTLENLKYTALINAYSILNIPLLAACMPQIVEVSDSRTVVRVRLGWRTRNHLGVMYFGALAMGAELSVALKAIESISKGKLKIDFIFKDFKADFLKRADGHVHFICPNADKVAALVKRTADSSERQSECFEGFACVPEHSEEAIMNYSLTLSMKQRSRGTRSSGAQ